MGMKKVAVKGKDNDNIDSDSERTCSNASESSDVPINKILEKLRRNDVEVQAHNSGKKRRKDSEIQQSHAKKIKRVAEVKTGGKGNLNNKVGKEGGRKGKLKETVTVEHDTRETKKKFNVHCRPGALFDLINNLTDKQKADVRDIGFGGLLCLKLNRLPSGMVKYMLGNFNYSSRCLSIGNKIICVTEEDVQDVFLLPKHKGKDVVEGGCEGVDELLDRWKEVYGLSFTGGLYVGKLYDLMVKEVKDGGDDFKRFFVLFSLSSFLTPVAKRIVYTRPLASLLDVGQISSYNWCQYVLDKLCEAAHRFDPNKANIVGCVLLLHLVYFHRLQWQGQSLPDSLPLILHWDRNNIFSRVNGELKVGPPFGHGRWVLESFPVSKDVDYSGLDVPVLHGVEEDHTRKQMSPPEDTLRTETSQPEDNTVVYKLCAGQMNDSQIHAAAKDDLDESFMILRRDLEVITLAHKKRVEKIKKRAEEGGLVDERDDTTPVSDTQKFFNNPELYRQIDELVEAFLALKKDNVVRSDVDAQGAPKRGEHRAIPMKEITAPTFHLLTPTPPTPSVFGSSPDYQQPFADNAQDAADDIEEEVDLNANSPHVDDDRDNRDEDVDDLIKKIVNSSLSKNVDEGDVNRGEGSAVKEKPQGTSGVENEDVHYASFYMHQHRKFVCTFPKRSQMIIDYALYDGEEADLEEVLFHNGDFHIVPRKDFASFNKGSQLFTTIIELWCLLLNEKSRQIERTRAQPRRFFFGVGHSGELEVLVTALSAETINVELVDKLEGGLKTYWRNWLDQNHSEWKTFIKTADMIFIPIDTMHKIGHYSCIVINHVDSRIQYQNFDDRIFVINAVVKVMKNFLREQRHAWVNDIDKYKNIEYVKFNWQSYKNVNNDCGVYLMKHMEHFEGFGFNEPNLALLI